MQQRDFLKDQIDQLSRVLGKILAEFLGLKTSGDVDNAIAVTNEQLHTELNLDIERLTQLSAEALAEYVASQYFTAEHLDQLSRYCFEIGAARKAEDDLTYLKYFVTAMRLLALAEQTLSTITFDRIDLKGRIERELER